MNDQLREILYGGIYDASPGSDRHQEQCRRVDAAIQLMEEEMAKKPRSESDEKRPEDFRSKMITKAHDDEGEEGESNGV